LLTKIHQNDECFLDGWRSFVGLLASGIRCQYSEYRVSYISVL